MPKETQTTKVTEGTYEVFEFSLADEREEQDSSIPKS